MKWKLVKLFVITGMLAWVTASTRVADAQGFNCNCTGTVTTVSYLILVDPVCEVHPYNQWAYTPTGLDCYAYCHNWAHAAATFSCDDDAGTCPNGGDPLNSFFTGDVFWNGSWPNYHSGWSAENVFC